MPYTAVGGGFERASRVGHREAVLRALADERPFHVPAEQVPDRAELAKRVRPRTDFPLSASEQLTAAIAIDGSRMVERVRDGLPSVVYGYAQTAAAYVDLAIMETQRASKFVDPYVIDQAVNTALVSFDLPVAGAYERAGIDIATSWREAIDRIFRTKKVEVNNLNQTLLDLLLLLHGGPGAPAATLEVNCPQEGCGAKEVPVPATATAPTGMPCPQCGHALFPTDVLRIHEEVVEEGTNEAALGRLMSVAELLVLTGLVTLLWSQHRSDLLPSTLFIVDGPLSMAGPPAKLRSRALDYFQAVTASTPGVGPFIVGVEKTGLAVDYARSLVRNEVLSPGGLLVVDEHVLAHLANTKDVKRYGKETYWGRKFIYRSLDGRVLVPTVLPQAGAPYDNFGGQPDPAAYPTLAAILDVFDRTGSSMYEDGIIPVALAHGKAAYPIGVGTDVLKLVARHKLGMAPIPPTVSM